MSPIFHADFEFATKLDVLSNLTYFHVLHIFVEKSNILSTSEADKAQKSVRNSVIFVSNTQAVLEMNRSSIQLLTIKNVSKRSKI
uniref:Uncharacterized protein n=1 Tax=Panagrolaimus sp. JU765 TaxID=591449 RepID=A0AC34RJQ6_9BILA